ncbi:NAD(P)/FAD-dependent oxidoreductase [Flexibacterium corallicola]|uniref:NAD(P)/FAD-dependent oxidoreductase n=1 Tax=Flexibacterium corallicola TaxID=3037259 RepID=UPI00286F9734|nr:tryptophan 7-halogenase [Pseudovibrio sp. M1P-2-3]
MKIVDILILGSGPAATMAAIGALQENPDINVALLSQETSAAHRIGEALLTGTIYTLQEAGVLDAVLKQNFHPKIGAAYVWGESRIPWYVDYPCDNSLNYPNELKVDEGRLALHVPRHQFDRILLEEAFRAGASLIEGKAKHAAIRGQFGDAYIQSITTGTGLKIKAKHYIDCTGQSAFLSKRLSIRKKISAPKVAKYFYSNSICWDTAMSNGFSPYRTNIISSDYGWMWFIHLGAAGGELTSVGFVGAPGDMKSLTPRCTKIFDKTLALFGSPLNGMRTYDNRPLDEFYKHPDYAYASEELHGKNWSLSGDAALFLDPILSQGVTLACHYGLMRGRAASRAIEGDVSANFNVTLNYKKEAAMLHKVVSSWYKHNKSVTDWKLDCETSSKQLGGPSNDCDRAFQWITNLENLSQDYSPYPNSQQIKINSNLGLLEDGS